MAIEPRELERVERPGSGRRDGAREGRRGRTAPRGTAEERRAGERRPVEVQVESPERRRWVQRHGATVFITFVFLFLVLLVVVKRLAM